MSRFAPLPDLDRLSSAEKDELILRLWHLVGGEAPGGEPDGTIPEGTAAPNAGRSAATRRTRALRAALGADASVRARTAVKPTGRLGHGLGLVRSRVAIGVLIAIGAAFAADAAVVLWQARALAAERRAALELENAAFGGLYAELVRIVPEPDGKSYRLTMTMQNTAGGPLHVMLAPLRVFVQTGLVWQEVPSEPVAGAGPAVVDLTGGHDYEAIFRPEITDWAELIPGYMHVRIDSDMLISRRPDPTTDIVERRNLYYVYLKPHGADDEDIKRRSGYRSTPPVYIPMPPH